MAVSKFPPVHGTPLYDNLRKRIYECEIKAEDFRLKLCDLHEFIEIDCKGVTEPLFGSQAYSKLMKGNDHLLNAIDYLNPIANKTLFDLFLGVRQ